jgi:quinol monooxygenase YgiN
MAYAVAAMWRALEGQQDEVRRILEQVAPLSRAEPGCRMFVVHESPDDPRTFFLYEQYDDESAFQAHAASEHVRRHVLEDAVHRLEHRERTFYRTTDA